VEKGEIGGENGKDRGDAKWGNENRGKRRRPQIGLTRI
jgi:hypothetical protein